MRRVSDIVANPRVAVLAGFGPDDDGGKFVVRLGVGGPVMVVLSWGAGWEHASVSKPNSLDTPTWAEMSAIHRLVWGDEEAMQLHVASKDHVNHHPGCLHIWRPASGMPEIPLPPSWMVGPVSTATVSREQQ